MPILELEVRANTGPGAAQAARDLSTVQKAADGATGSAAKLSASLASTFSATAGGLQVAQGITATAQAFSSLSTATGAFNLSRLVLDVAKTAEDFRGLRREAGATGGVLSSLWGIARANPIVAVVSALGAAATAMSLFGTNSQKAADQLAEASKRAADFRSSIAGISAGAVAGGSSYTSALENYAAKIRADQFGNVQFGRPLDGRNTAEGEQYLYLREADKLLPGIFNQRSQDGNFGRTLPYGRLESGRSQGYGHDFLLSRSDFDREVLTRADRSRVAREYESSLPGLYQFGQGDVRQPFNLNVPDASGPANYVEQSAMDRARVEEEADRKHEQAMERAAANADLINQSLGAVAADLVLAGGNFRQVLLSIVQSGARQGLAAGFSSAFSAIGATGTQLRQNNMPRAGAGEMVP